MKKRRAVLPLLLALVLAGCQPAPSEVVEEITKLEEAQRRTTQAAQELEKDSIANLRRDTPAQADLDLGTIRLKGAVRVPDVQEIPVLTLERNTTYYDKFDQVLQCIVPEDEINISNITLDDRNPERIRKVFLYNTYEIFCYPTCPFAIWNNGFSNPADYEKVDTIRLYRGEQVDPEQTYQMDGKQVKLKDALDYANRFLAQQALNLRPGYTFQIRTVFPRLLEDGENYGIEFYVESCYKGVPFDSVYGYPNDNWKANQNTTRKSESAEFLITDGFLKKIKRFSLPESYQVVKETPTDNRFLTLEAAAGQLKKVLTGGTIFQFNSAELVYDIRYSGYYQYTKDELENVKQLTASPVWLFIIDKDKSNGEYTNPYTHDIRETYIVDAITGDVSIYNENVSY